ncbi:MAG TPA: phytanoyl-CoA dioxygenase family protein [Pyrinomonadaceae bacterium]|nr:phytanoyl-CoA dioxygenase family protein [Pyrinomonadaceae bacterium]
MSSVKVNYIDDIAREGFAVIEGFLDSETVDSLIRELAKAKVDEFGSQRAGRAFGLRNLLNAVPATRELANSAALRSLVKPILGNTARVVRSIYFDKHTNANWKVAWHQDLTIAVREKLEIEGFNAWSIKAGIPHVQPPLSILNNLLTLRVHLDHADDTNGALRVLPGTHRHGRLDANQIQFWKENQRVVTCSVPRGGVMVMRPLLLHSSLPALEPEHRRVLHFEYSSVELPAELEWFEESASAKM